MKAQRGLGKGLGALIPGGWPEQFQDSAGPQAVAVGDIGPNPRQPRHAIDEVALETLAASLRQVGILQPLLVTNNPSPAGPRYLLIAGERRWRAAQLAGLTRVPVVVKDSAPQEMLELALVENIQRADLNPLEEAAAYHQLTEEFGLTQEQVAGRVGRGRVSVANALRLLSLPPEIQAALAARRISEGHARALLGFPDPPAQVAALSLVIAGDFSVRQIEELARRAGKKRPRRGGRAAAPETRALEEQFRRALGTKVSLFRSAKGGKLVIHFYSDEELQALFDRLLVGDV